MRATESLSMEVIVLGPDPLPFHLHPLVALAGAGVRVEDAGLLLVLSPSMEAAATLELPRGLDRVILFPGSGEHWTAEGLTRIRALDERIEFLCDWLPSDFLGREWDAIEPVVRGRWHWLPPLLLPEAELTPEPAIADGPVAIAYRGSEAGLEIEYPARSRGGKAVIEYASGAKIALLAELVLNLAIVKCDLDSREGQAAFRQGVHENWRWILALANPAVRMFADVHLQARRTVDLCGGSLRLRRLLGEGRLTSSSSPRRMGLRGLLHPLFRGMATAEAWSLSSAEPIRAKSPREFLIDLEAAVLGRPGLREQAMHDALGGGWMALELGRTGVSRRLQFSLSLPVELARRRVGDTARIGWVDADVAAILGAEPTKAWLTRFEILHAVDPNWVDVCAAVGKASVTDSEEWHARLLAGVLWGVCRGWSHEWRKPILQRALDAVGSGCVEGEGNFRQVYAAALAVLGRLSEAESILGDACPVDAGRAVFLSASWRLLHAKSDDDRTAAIDGLKAGEGWLARMKGTRGDSASIRHQLVLVRVYCGHMDSAIAEARESREHFGSVLPDLPLAALHAWMNGQPDAARVILACELPGEVRDPSMRVFVAAAHALVGDPERGADLLRSLAPCAQSVLSSAADPSFRWAVMALALRALGDHAQACAFEAVGRRLHPLGPLLADRAAFVPARLCAKGLPQFALPSHARSFVCPLHPPWLSQTYP